MGKRSKRLEKQEMSLLRQAEKHLKKAKTEIGRKDTTKGYWLTEAEKFKKQAEKRVEMRKKLQKSRRN